MSFRKVIEGLDWVRVNEQIYQKRESDVLRALYKNGNRNLDDFMALISPAAAPFLEDMATISHRITKKRFGKTMQMYLPLYLSNKCHNSCLYCGFRKENKMKRIVLDEDQILQEVEVIKSYGFDHVLLVTGESDTKVGVEYFEKVLKLIRPHFSHISMEVQPLKQEEYTSLIKSGLNTVLVYQETYGKDYAEFHPRGSKADFNYRLETPDRLGRAGIHKIGLGCLLGLADWRTDSWYVGLHMNYLEKKYWKTKYSISFPRLRPATGIMEPRVVITDPEFVQLICAYRIFNENVELSLSTRESEKFRNHAVKFGITSISAGSKTDPGGYSATARELEQFQIDDDRSPQEIATMLQAQGYESVWKDWDMIYGI
ncbi:MAG: 2-iminoacetate synthase ThiH [Proteobacteria bacterium]|nr:2-iminoacetate synthase ThiH [Pseudomonadota bacterium]